MNFLADMGVSLSTTEWLLNSGHSAIHVKDIGMKRASDADIIEYATIHDMIILTFDLDFGSLMASLQQQYPSVILFRLKNATPQNVNKRLEDVLESSEGSLAKGAIIIVENEKHRIRLLPI